MLQTTETYQEYDYAEALKTGKPRNNFDALLLQVADIDLDLAALFIALAKACGWGKNDESNSNDIAQQSRLSDVPEIKYEGDPALLKQTARAALETMEENGHLAFEDEQSRNDFLDNAELLTERALVDGKFDHEAFERALKESAGQYNINFLKFNDPDPAAVDFSNQVTGKIEFKDGSTVFTPNDGGDPIMFTLDNLDIYDLADSERDKLVMDQVAYVQTAHLSQHFTGEVTLTAVALQDADADASNAEVVAWRLSGDDKNYYIGQDSFITPQKEWHAALTSGFEENRALDNDNNLRADQSLTLSRAEDLTDRIENAMGDGNISAAQKLKADQEELLSRVDQIRSPSAPSFGSSF